MANSCLGKLATVAALMLCGTSALAQDAPDNSWKFAGLVYGFMAGIGGEAINGADISFDAHSNAGLPARHRSDHSSV